MLLSFPVVVPVLKNMTPPFVPTAMLPEPRTEQLVIVFEVASDPKRIVEVPDVALAVVFEIVKLLPPLFNPLKVTLSAPFKFIKEFAAVVVPVMVRAAPPTG